MIVLAAMLLVLLFPANAAAVQCKHTGKSWRLVDNRKCWTDRWMPKDKLYWAPAPHRIVLRRPPPQRKPKPAPPVPRESDHPYPAPKPRADLESALQARAEELRGDMAKPRLIRTILVGPIEARAAVELIPLPVPRPRAPRAPLRLFWSFMLAAMTIMDAMKARA